MSTPLSSTLLFASIVCMIRHASAACYMINGTEITDPVYQPCNQVAGTISMCCGKNWTTAQDDACLPNGLCQNYGPTYNEMYYWRDSCTDPTWKSPYCLNLCMAEDDINPEQSNNLYARVAQCTDGSWCCAGNKNNVSQCCQEGKGVVLAATIGITASSFSSSSTSSTSMPVSTSTSGLASAVTPVVSATSTPSSPWTDGLTLPAKLGLGIGTVFGAILVAVR
jgi:hypothetical protein